VDRPAYGYLAAKAAQAGPVLVLAQNHSHMQQLAAETAFFDSALSVTTLPAWDVQPFDRLSPDVALQAGRMRGCETLQEANVIVTTVNALSTRLPAQRASAIVLSPETAGSRAEKIQALLALGYARVGMVSEPREFAVRGEVLDVYPADGEGRPVRLDFFDDDIESLKTFDPLSQRSEDWVASVTLPPASELVPDEAALSLFRQGYRTYFPQGVEDDLYAMVSEGQLPPQAIHYLPLFFEKPLYSAFDLLPQKTLIVAPPTFADALKARQESIADAYETRLKLLAQGEGVPYRPLPPELLYLTEADWLRAQEAFPWVELTDFDDGAADLQRADMHGHHFGSTISQRQKGVVASITNHKGQAVLVAFTQAGLNQLEKALRHEDEGILNRVSMQVGPLRQGFAVEAKLYITEQDVFGPRQAVVSVGKRRGGDVAIAHFSDLQVGDYIVHDDHGVGRFDRLETLEVDGTRQDFLKIFYAGDDRVYVPVEALNVISRYSSAEAGTPALDKLGGAAWQARRARVKKDLLAIAEALMKTAAARRVLEKQPLLPPAGLYDDFAATFPYQTTVEQQAAIQDVLEDMSRPHPMDRLIVGDVGFGKTEVALRAACVAVGCGRQVAVVCPTTLLARQHYDVFSQRFAGFPFRIAQLSRLVSSTEARRVKSQLGEGQVDIVIGTHALLSKDVSFKNLALLVIDEEQRFGVAHKEKLKQLKANVDVLTLTATPIPRTMHMALGGLKQLSTITTPPVDRLAVRSYVLGFDAKVLREAILREIHRGGQVYVVTPKVKGIPKLAETLQTLVPEASFGVAHGQMPEQALEKMMAAFYAGEFQVLIATTIIESGLDVPQANTLIVHEADRFGLSQLHQLRGRVGRRAARAYAYFLLPEGHLGERAERRLRILQRLEGLGAGFQLASFDMDIRGAGNLVGKEQSGHLNDVGFELYAKLLQEAVSELQAQQHGAEQQVGTFSPVLNLGISYLIPEDYVPDIATRMQLYRRLAQLENEEAIEDFRSELADRFGNVPVETESLLAVVAVRNRCQDLNIDKLDAGSQGSVIRFHQNRFEAPEALLAYIQAHAGTVSVNKDQTLTFYRAWGDEAEKRLVGVQRILTDLEVMVKQEKEQQVDPVHD
jgi:transcription-repair coupling factor (superfamily II helicase)